MKKNRKLKGCNDLRQEYDLAKPPGDIRGKYYDRVMAGTNLVLIEPDLASVFPDAKAVNRTLRVLVDVAQNSQNSEAPAFPFQPRVLISTRRYPNQPPCPLLSPSEALLHFIDCRIPRLREAQPQAHILIGRLDL
jgi:hypothetical protein